MTAGTMGTGPKRDPSLRNLAIRVVLEAEVCTTGQRKRRQGANRNGDPLDQLHCTSSPPLRAVPPIRCGTPSLARPPSGGHRGSLSDVPSLTHKPPLSPTADNVGLFCAPARQPFHP
jgi:hypothetical protein